MDDVQRWLAVKKVAAIFCRKKIRRVNLSATAASEVVAVCLTVAVEFDPRGILATTNSPRMRFADPKAVSVIRCTLIRRWHTDVWIASKHVVRHRQCVDRRLASAAWEAITNFVHRKTKRPDTTRNRFDRTAIGFDAKVGMMKIDGLF